MKLSRILLPFWFLSACSAGQIGMKGEEGACSDCINSSVTADCTVEKFTQSKIRLDELCPARIQEIVHKGQRVYHSIASEFYFLIQSIEFVQGLPVRIVVEHSLRRNAVMILPLNAFLLRTDGSLELNLPLQYARAAAEIAEVPPLMACPDDYCAPTHTSVFTSVEYRRDVPLFFRLFRRQQYVEVSFLSKPSGAAVYIDDIERGATPLKLHIDRNFLPSVVVRKNGHPPCEWAAPDVAVAGPNSIREIICNFE